MIRAVWVVLESGFITSSLQIAFDLLSGCLSIGTIGRPGSVSCFHLVESFGDIAAVGNQHGSVPVELELVLKGYSEPNFYLSMPYLRITAIPKNTLGSHCDLLVISRSLPRLGFVLRFLAFLARPSIFEHRSNGIPKL